MQPSHGPMRHPPLTSPPCMHALRRATMPVPHAARRVLGRSAQCARGPITATLCVSGPLAGLMLIPPPAGLHACG